MHKVVQEYTVAGTVTSFDREAFVTNLALAVRVPTSAISLTVEAASVKVTAEITAESETQSARVADTLTGMTTSDANGGSATASEMLGVTVLDVSDATTKTERVPASSMPPSRTPPSPVASPPQVASPPPSPSPSPSPSPVALPPSVASPSLAATLVTLTTPILRGWNWISLNVAADDMTINGIFGEITWSTSDMVKNQMAFSTYYEGYGFFGGLTTLSVDESYAIQYASTTSATLRVAGTPISLPRPVTFAGGWAWLPMPYQRAVSLADGAPTFQWSNADTFKSQMSFSQYYDGYGWFGTLTTLTPGMGYKAKTANTGTGTFASL